MTRTCTCSYVIGCHALTLLPMALGISSVAFLLFVYTNIHTLCVHSSHCIVSPLSVSLLSPPRLEHVTELLLYDNMLESLPTSLFQMKSLEMLNVDRNHLMEIPASVSVGVEEGMCKRVHVLMFIWLYLG